MVTSVYIKENVIVKHEEDSKKFVTSVTVSEVFVSAGIQMLHVANDLAFTDSAYGTEWSFETANRLATLSELLNAVYKRLDASTLEIVINLPPTIVGQVIENPMYEPPAEKPASKDAGDAADIDGDDYSIGDLPF